MIHIRKKINRLQILKLGILLLCVPLMGFGIALCLLAGYGSDVYTCVQQGIAFQLKFQVGTINFILNCAILLLFLKLDRSLVGIGSILMSVFTGPFITLFSTGMFHLVNTDSPISIRAIATAVGILCNAVSIAFYVPLKSGVQPMDMLVLTISKCFKKSYGFGMYIFNIAALLLAIALKATVGIGTLANLLTIGALVDFINHLVVRLYHKWGILSVTLPVSNAEEGTQRE